MTMSLLAMLLQIQAVASIYETIDRFVLRNVPMGFPSTYLFPQFDTSQELCRELYGPWWKDFLERRLALAQGTIYNDDDFLGLLVPLLPMVPHYEHSPVQSIGARLGSRGSRIAPFERSKTGVQICNTACEDERSDVELWIAQRIDASKRQVRYRAPLFMRCKSGYEAWIEDMPDLRERKTPELMAFEETLDRENARWRNRIKPEEYPMRDAIGSPVKRCRCISERARALRTALELRRREKGKDRVLQQHAAQCSDYIDVRRTSEVQPQQAQACAPIDEDCHPFREASDELESAAIFWAELYPWKEYKTHNK